jgi:hypothetical protein
MSDETFPNENLYQQAFTATDSVPLLLQLLKESLTHSIHDPLIYYIKTVEDNPSRGESLSSALARVGYSPDTPTFRTTESLSFLIVRELTCIQLLLHGSMIVTEDVGSYGKRAEVVARTIKLKAR